MSEGHRRELAEFLLAQPETSDLSLADVLTAQTREDLGMSSLTTVLLMVRYVEQRAGAGVTIQPEWVSRLGDVDGMAAVLHEIDAGSERPAPANT